MTRKLYYESAYETEWETVITASWEKDGAYYAELAETAFYPHGGGQPCDTGSLNGIPVLDVTEEDGRVIHRLERMPESAEAACVLDWERRFDHMQHHSGQHLLSAVCRRLLDAPTVSFHLGQDTCTIDIETAALTPAQMKAAEAEVTREIYAARAIHAYYVEPEELDKLQLPKPPKVTENIRIVETEGVEYNACGGTHVAHTGQIGIVKLLHTEKIRGITRLHFKCGLRALADYGDALGVLDQLGSRLGASRRDLSTRLDKLEQEQKALRSRCEELADTAARYEAQELITLSGAGPVARLYDDKPVQELQKVAAAAQAAGCGALLLATRNGNKLVLAGGDSGLDCGAFLKAHLSAFGGKGGGSAQLAQGAFPEPAGLESFFSFAVRQLGE